MKLKNPLDFVNDKEAQSLTGYGRSNLQKFRYTGKIEWTALITGKKIRYNKASLLKLIGMHF